MLHPVSATPPPIWATFGSGAAAGLISTVLGTPSELVKCRLQVQGGEAAAGRRYAGNLDCIKQIVAKDGLRGLYRGQMIMMARESLAFGTYFTTYDLVKRQLQV